MTMQELTPTGIHAPFAAYSHGVMFPAGWRVLRTSGQLGIGVDGTVPASAFGQASLCFGNIREILHAGGLAPGDVVHISAWVTDRAHMAAYMQARDAFLAGTGRCPASTVIIVSGFSRPEYMVEVEAMAAAP